MRLEPKPSARALLAGLVALAKHTEDQVKVIVQLAIVWEVWHQPKSRSTFQDIFEGLTPQDLSRVTVLYISRNTRTPDAPGNEPQLRTQWNLDGSHKLIATQALYKPCKGAATKGSPPLSEFFKKKDTTGSTSQGSTSSPQNAVCSRPTPKRLHFNTELDEQEALNQQLSALAMNPSHTADDDTAADDNAGIAVDYF